MAKLQPGSRLQLKSDKTYILLSKSKHMKLKEEHTKLMQV